MILGTFGGLVEDGERRRSRVLSLELVYRYDRRKEGEEVQKGNGVKVSSRFPSFPLFLPSLPEQTSLE